MRSHLLAFIAAGTMSLAIESPLFAQTGSEDRYPTGPVTELTNDVRQVLKQYSRERIDDAARATTRNTWRYTSKDRKGALKSPAHDRGATDFAPRRGAKVRQRAYDAYAAGMARKLGQNYTAIVERTGRTYDLNTSYRLLPNGQLRTNGPYRVPKRATGNHIHVQPSRAITIRNGASNSRVQAPVAAPPCVPSVANCMCAARCNR